MFKDTSVYAKTVGISYCYTVHLFYRMRPFVFSSNAGNPSNNAYRSLAIGKPLLNLVSWPVLLRIRMVSIQKGAGYTDTPLFCIDTPKLLQ